MDKKNNITIEGRVIEYVLKRSNRKTIGIRIDTDGNIKVTAPVKTSRKQIKDTIVNEAPWILKKQEEMIKINQEKKRNAQFIDGDRFLFLGKEYLLTVYEMNNLQPEVLLYGGSIIVCIAKGKSGEERVLCIRNALKTWYMDRFESILRERVPELAASVDVSPASIKIKEQKTRWGSCSNKGNINLNWKLVMAPMEVIDYVIVHELCHMKEMNHLKAFWTLVGAVLPEYPASRKWLRENGKIFGI
jgi:predicted metal-dependent hydrolase